MAKQRYRIMLGAPSGGTVQYGAAKAMFLSSKEHDVVIWDSQRSGGNLNALWAAALNNGKAGNFTHFAMLHSDILIPDESNERRWIDVLVDELETTGADLVSSVVAIKDGRGVTSSGIGNPRNRWVPLRRFTVTDLADMPETFTAAQAGYPGYALMHNNGCWVADLRKPLWYKWQTRTDPDTGEAIQVAPIYGEFRERLRVVNDAVVNEQESEDWYFSRVLHEQGANSIITQKVKNLHMGGIAFPSFGLWGTYKFGDEDTAGVWRNTPEYLAEEAKRLAGFEKDAEESRRANNVAVALAMCGNSLSFEEQERLIGSIKGDVYPDSMSGTAPQNAARL